MRRLFALYLRKRLHHQLVDDYLQSKCQLDMTFDKIENRVAVIQKSIKPVRKVKRFIDTIYSFVENATKNGATYVIFPEYIFFDLFGVIPFFRFINYFLNRITLPTKRKNKNHLTESNDNRLLYVIFDLFAQPTEKVIVNTMKRLAKHFSVYIFTGSYLHKEADRLYNVGTLIDPEGNIIYTQQKVHLTDFEADIGLARGDNFQVLDLPIGKTATPICMDATYFETFRIVRHQGANIVIIPIANNEPYQQWKALRGIWPRVQESYVFGLKPALTGSIAGMHFTGKAGVFAPIEMTEKRDGIIGITENAIGNDIIYADLDIEQLVSTRINAPYYNDANPLFETNYFERTYLHFT